MNNLEVFIITVVGRGLETLRDMFRVTKRERSEAGILLGMTLDCHGDTLCGDFHVEIQARDCESPRKGLEKGAQQRGF